MRWHALVILCMLIACMALCGQAEELSNAEYKYKVTDGQVTITRYLGDGGTVKIPANIDGLPVTMIGNSAFRYMSSKKITHVTIPDTVTVIGDHAFASVLTLTSVNFSSNLTSIGPYAFYDNRLTNVTLPASVTSLGRAAFNANKTLEKLTLPSGITELGASIVNAGITIYCDMDSVTAKNLTDRDFVDPDKPYFFMRYKEEGSGLVLTKYNGSHSNVYIPDGVTEIAREAFSGAIYMHNITIPDSVTTISAVAFESCRNLQKVTIPDSVTSIGSNAFLGCTQLRQVKLPSGDVQYGNGIFADCTGLTSIEFPPGNTAISQSMFSSCTSLSSVKIPSSVTSIGNHAFMKCTSLREITLLDNITSIGGGVFAYLDKVTIVCYQGSYVDEWAAANSVKVKYLAPLNLPGDADNSGVIDIMDALAILQHSVGWEVSIDTDASDVNDDGVVDIMDALLILQHSVGWDVELK